MLDNKVLSSFYDWLTLRLSKIPKMNFDGRANECEERTVALSAWVAACSSVNWKTVVNRQRTSFKNPSAFFFFFLFSFFFLFFPLLFSGADSSRAANLNRNSQKAKPIESFPMWISPNEGNTSDMEAPSNNKSMFIKVGHETLLVFLCCCCWLSRHAAQWTVHSLNFNQANLVGNLLE